MRLLPIRWRIRLSQLGLFPTSKLARAAWYVLGQTVLLILLEQGLSAARVSWAKSFSGSIIFFGFIAALLFFILGVRELKARLLWRLRNRLIVTYVFIGVIPAVLLVALALGSFYLFAGQFATFIVTTSLNSELKSLDTSNSAITHELAAQLQHGATPEALGLESLRRTSKAWNARHVHAWRDGKLVLSSSPDGAVASVPALPGYLKSPFHEVVRDHGELYLRSFETMQAGNETLTVLSSEPLDKHFLQSLASNLGQITLYASGLSRVSTGVKKSTTPGGTDVPYRNSVSVGSLGSSYVFDTSQQPSPTYVVGDVPPPTQMLDRQVSFATAISVVDWDTGATTNPAAIGVQTRLSQLYDRLFGALGDFAPAIEYSLLIVAVVFGIIELVALIIGTSLTRTVTGAVAQLYDATGHVNRGDLGHRIPVKSSDQLATLANSFNSMTASLEELIQEQKEKQRLEGELAIAQEVQEQLYPREISQLASLEVHGFCRPARTVSGDYYDFLTMEGERMLLAVGDISGKGISAALLMATIHSAVRAYSVEGMPAMRGRNSDEGGSRAVLLAAEYSGDTSPGNLLGLLNHQLFESTPQEKYATLFLAAYDGPKQKLTYSNGGHLPPLVLSEDGSVQRLECGGTVVGLFDDCSYEEGGLQLRPGDLFVAYSDGVTEPENEFGEFGEERLIQLIQENRSLPLVRITEIVTAAVLDWIGANEQPDDVTLVLARVR